MAHVRSVLFVTYHFPPEIGGIQTRISRYVRELGRRGIAVTVFVLTSHGSEARRYKMEGSDVVVLPGNLQFFVRNSLYLLRAVISSRVDVIHVFTGAQTYFGIFSLLVGRVKGIPSVISFFGKEQFVTENAAQKALLPFSLSLATSIAVNTPHTQGFVPAVYAKKGYVLLGGADMSEPVGAHSGFHFGETKTILFVGRLVERKGVDDLVKAFPLVRDAFPGTRLVIIGDGPERKQLEVLARSLGVDTSVEFRGALTGEPLQVAYEESSVVALPSKYVKTDPATEGLGLTLIEASMHAKPLVGTLHGGIPEIITDGLNGFLVSEDNPEELAAALTRILSDKELAKRMGKAALQMAEAKFTWEAATNRLLECYSR